jgi:post-segregation antitoxin (ccd killing protein)
MPARRSVPLAAAAAVATAALIAAPAAGAQAPAPAPARTITAVAAGRVTLDRDVAQNSRAIGAAVEAARNRAIRVAIANAREEAQRLAAAGGLTLGPLVSVAEPQPSPFFGGPGGATYGAEGTFGPGKFCGQIRTPIRRRDARGVLRNTGRVRVRFGCRVPSEVAQTVSATFAVS